MKYRAFIEDNFLIDEPNEGKLVPFHFNKAQELYYQELCTDYDIETKGIGVPVREMIVKARREGFSSLILALFAADDILQSNPTESMVISYKDDATMIFRKRYRRYVLSWYTHKAGITTEQIQMDPNVLESFSKQCFSVDAADLEIRHNKAHFYCGSAAARTGGRGGVLQKLLFSEEAHYQDSEKMTAREIVEGTMRQVDQKSGWVFRESTGNGKGNHFYRTYETIVRGLSRFVLRFYGWRSFYTDEQFKIIASEFTDADMLKQEYPETIDEAFLSSNLAFTNSEELLAMIGVSADKKLHSFLELQGVNYIDQCELIRDYLLTLVKMNPNRDFYIGIDSAKDVDKTIATVLVSKDLVAQSGIKCIAIDATGAGDFMPDWFERNAKWYVHRVKFSRQTKSVLYKHLRVVIQDRRTELPPFLTGKEFLSDEWQQWYREMLDLQKQIIGQLLVVAHPSGDYHDDYPDSWALAETGYVIINGAPMGKRPPDEPSSFDDGVRRMLANRSSGSGKGVDRFD